jgi:hypothetical protein
LSYDDQHITNNSSDPAALQWNKVIPDILGVMLYYLFFDLLMQWQAHHLALSCTILMMLNIAAVGIAARYFIDTATV